MTRALLVAAALALGACHANSYCLDCDNTTSTRDGGGGAGGGSGVDLAMSVDGGQGDLASCDPTVIDTDPNNCGGCGIRCPRAHAVPACVAGKCTIEACDVGWVDLDKDPNNDCEYACLETGSEICDGKDNDCNGEIDETFDLKNDGQNCGTCGNVCAAANGVESCQNGKCALVGCATGYADLDPNVAGCEYHCPVYPPLPNELCNGLDDNCDGVIDEPAHLEAAPTSLCVTRANTPCAGTVAKCQTRNNVTTWYCQYGADVEFNPALPNGLSTVETKCDGKDGNCDGQADESFGGLGGSCDNGKLGACRDVGVVKCSPTDTSKTICDLSVLPDATPGAPSVEKCNNVDDDCDGVVDNTTNGTASSMRLVRDMVHITSVTPDYWIDRYEASRPDATSSSAGSVTARSCSNSGVVPWTSVSFDAAKAACTAAGMRLCTGTEWGQACAGAGALAYPYGNSYVGATCNGIDFAATAALRATKAAAMCASDTSVYDLSGNAKEWTDGQQGTTAGGTPIYVLRGGSYLSPSGGLTCATTFSRASSDTVLSDIGFRCCSSSAP